MYIGFILSASIIKKKEYIQIICKIIIFSALFITIAPNYNPNFSYINYINVFHNTNHYGYFLMISTILSGFMFVKNTGIKKIIYLLIYIFLIYMLIYNDTFGCYLSLLIVLIFSLIYSIVKKYKIVNIIILIVTFLLTSFIVSFTNIEIGGKIILQDTQKMVYNNFSVFSHDIKTIVNEESDLDTIGTGRGLLWKTAWNYTLEHPLIGGGMECLNEYFKTHNAGYNDRPHNIILQFTSFIGIPGAIIYIILIGYLAIINLKNLNKDTTYFMVYVSAMCYFISSNFGNSMYYTSPYFMILLGFLISMQFTNSKET